MIDWATRLYLEVKGLIVIRGDYSRVRAWGIEVGGVTWVARLVVWRWAKGQRPLVFLTNLFYPIWFWCRWRRRFSLKGEGVAVGEVEMGWLGFNVFKRGFFLKQSGVRWCKGFSWGLAQLCYKALRIILKQGLCGSSRTLAYLGFWYMKSLFLHLNHHRIHVRYRKNMVKGLKWVLIKQI